MSVFSFALRPPRHPLLRAVLALGGLALLGAFAAFGVVVAAIVLAGFGLRRVWRNARIARPAAAPREVGVIDGEFTVVSKPHATLLPR
jgi:hypothetical protein